MTRIENCLKFEMQITFSVGFSIRQTMVLFMTIVKRGKGERRQLFKAAGLVHLGAYHKGRNGRTQIEQVSSSSL